MLARRRPQREQPLLRLFQLARIGVGLVREPAEQRLRLRQRLLRPVQRRQRGAGTRVLAQFLQRPRGRAQARRRARAAPVARRDLGQGVPDRLAAPLVLLQAQAFGRQAVLLPLRRRQPAQLYDGMPQPILLALHLRQRRPRPLQRGGTVPPRRPGDPRRRLQPRRHPERVE